jgi:[ribosomal protein S5]-alanine N-acetyltransferase
MIRLLAMDAEDLGRLAAGEMPRWIGGQPAPGSLPPVEAAARRWQQLRAATPVRWCVPWLILDHADQVVGSCTFKGRPLERRIELGYRVSPEHQGRGYATLAVQGLLDIAADSGEVDEVFAHILESNLASARVVQRAGFRLHGPVVDEFGDIVMRWLRRIDRAAADPVE